MHLLFSIAVVIGFTFVVVLGVLSVLTDLLALTRRRPPSIFEEFSEEDRESENRNRLSTSSDVVGALASRTIAPDINAAH